MKINNKKTLLVLAAVALVGGTFTAVALTKENGFSVSAVEDENTIWKHYAAVAPDPDKKQFGSKEFWANCSEIGTHVFEAPTIGKIQDGGDFSKTAYFKELTPEDDRYVPYEYTVTFDSNGAAAIDPVTVGYGKTLTAPATPTRAEDAYYKAYTFDAWYANGKAFDFTKDTIKESVTLTAGWKYGDKKFDEVTLTKDNMTFGEKSAFMSFSGAFDQMAWDGTNKKVDQEKKAQYIEEFGGAAREKDGIFFITNGGPTTGATTPVSLPKINFKEKLAGGKIMSMEFGGRTDGSKMSYQGYEIFSCSNHYVANLTCAKAYFYLKGDAVEVRFVNKTYAAVGDIFTCTEKTFTLSEDVATGTASFTLDAFINQYNRHLWLGHPRIVKTESTYLDFSAKEHLTIANAVLKTREDLKGTESDVAPYGQWTDTVALSFDGIAASGNSSKPFSVEYEKIDFNSLFKQGLGVRFTLGSWNGGEKMSFGDIQLGTSAVKPGNPTKHTVETIANTWHNFQVEITKVGMRVFNYNENKEYMVALSENQLSGKEGLSFAIGSVEWNNSNGHIYYLSNMKTFHA